MTISYHRHMYAARSAEQSGGRWGGQPRDRRVELREQPGQQEPRQRSPPVGCEFEDVNGLSMDPNVWGAPLWSILFFVAKHADDDARASLLQALFKDLEHMLPCSSCRRHYATYRPQAAAAAKGAHGDRAVQFLWVVHDMVNQNLGKFCMGYDNLAKKLNFSTLPVSDTDIVDMVVMMWYASKQKEKVETALHNLMALLGSIHPFYCYEVYERTLSATRGWTDEMLLAFRNEACKLHGVQEETLGAMRARYLAVVAR